MKKIFLVSFFFSYLVAGSGAPTCLSTYIPMYSPTCSSMFPPIYSPTCLHADSPIYSPTCSDACCPIYTPPCPPYLPHASASNFNFMRAYTHGAPTESVSMLCDCGDERYVAIAGYNNFDCVYPKSLRIVSIDHNTGHKLTEIPVDIPAPSNYLYAVDGICMPPYGLPTFAFAGCPDDEGNVAWVYQLDPATNTFVQILKWGANEIPKPATMYSIAISSRFCGVDQDLQIAVTGKAINNVARVYITRIYRAAMPLTIETQHVIKLVGGNLYALAWLAEHRPSNACRCNIPCTVLSVGGKYVTGEDCKSGNIHNFAVTCDGIVTEIVSHNGGGAITLESPDYTVRRLVWSDCCDKYPYPFLLATGDRPIYRGFASKIVVYWYAPLLGEFNELAMYTMPGKIFAGQFTPGCDCKSITIAGGCFDRLVPCTPKILTLCYECGPQYPTYMNVRAMTHFDDVVTSLAFCPGDPYDSMVVTSETQDYMPTHFDPLCANKSKNEIGVYRVNFCRPIAQHCVPTPACMRSGNLTDLPADHDRHEGLLVAK